MIERICLICSRPFKTYKKTQFHCSHSCGAQSRIGKKAGNWKGGKRVTDQGYIKILEPDHPAADQHGYIFEHRKVIEKQLGRYLKSWEIVHHLDGNKKNNKKNNLVVTRHGTHEKTYHKGIARKTKIKCTFDKCERFGISKGLCNLHYKKQWRQQKTQQYLPYS